MHILSCNPNILTKSFQSLVYFSSISSAFPMTRLFLVYFFYVFPITRQFLVYFFQVFPITRLFLVYIFQVYPVNRLSLVYLSQVSPIIRLFLLCLILSHVLKFNHVESLMPRPRSPKTPAHAYATPVLPKVNKPLNRLSTGG